jgi:hypothetical protein
MIDHRLRTARTLCACALLLLLASPSILAQTPRTISVQGVLAEPSGAFVADGEHRLRLTLYDAPTGGGAIYTETQRVSVSAGLFNVLLGEAGGGIPPTVAFDRAYFLGVAVDGGAELAPRTPMTTAPYAMRASVADRASSVVEAGSYNIDDVLGAHPGWTDGQALQWIVDRIVRADDDTPLATPRSVRVIVPRRVIDVTGEPLKETTSPNGGVTPGANCRILIPPTGPLSAHPMVTLLFSPEGGLEGTFSYSVVSGGNASVPSRECVIATRDTTGTALLGVSRAIDGYAGTYLSNVIVMNDGVIFRVPNGAPISACDLSQAASIGGRSWIVDVDASSDQIADPRPHGSFALRTPRIANAAQLAVDRISVMGYAFGVEVNEHLHVHNAFINYCGVAWMLNVTSHTALIDKSAVQWCPVHFRGPRSTASQWGAFDCKLVVLSHGFELYDTNYFGHRWYEHENIVEDPGGMWSGELHLQVDASWLRRMRSFMPRLHGIKLRILPSDNWPVPRIAATTVEGNPVQVVVDSTQLDGGYWYQPEPTGHDAFVVEKWFPPGVHTVTWTGRSGPDCGILTLEGSDEQADFYEGVRRNNVSRSFTVTQTTAGMRRLVFHVAAKRFASSGYRMDLTRMSTEYYSAH